MRPVRLRALHAIVALALLVPLAACDNNDSPSAPDPTTAALVVENLVVRLTLPQAGSSGDAVAELDFTVRETAGIGATLSTLTVTLTDRGGATQTMEIDPAEAFGARRIAGGGTLTAKAISATTRLDLDGVAVRITFADDGGEQGSVEESMEVSIDVSGTWTGELPIRTPVGQWTAATLTLEQTGDEITGTLQSADGFQYLVTGSVTGAGFDILVNGLPGTSTCAGVGLTVSELEFRDGRLERLRGRAFGRCFGTIAGHFELQRTAR